MQHLNNSFRPRRQIGLTGGFLLLLCVAVAAALLIFWLFLADYQRTLPKNLADQIAIAYQTGDAKTIERYCVNLPEGLEKPAQFTKYYSENTNLSNLYFYPVTTANPAELCYEFVSGGISIATLTLRKTGHTSRFGFSQYEITSITGYPLTTYQITAPADAVLFVNGKLLSERYCTGEQTSATNFSTLIDTVSQTKTYEITDFTYIDELGVFTADNRDCSVTWSEDHRIATVKKQISEQQQQEITEFAVQFSMAYSVFATKQNGARAPVVQLLYPNTPFYSALLLYNNDWGEAYVSDRYENQVVDQLIQYSPTEFSCNISFDYVIQFRDGFEKIYPYSMTYYLTKQSGRLLLVDMQAQAS